MKSKHIIILCISLVLMSCKSECIGYVYSKHGAPVANASIFLYSQNGGGNTQPSSKMVASTNEEGLFFFKLKRKGNYLYWLKCTSDSAVGGYLDSKSNAITIRIE